MNPNLESTTAPDILSPSSVNNYSGLRRQSVRLRSHSRLAAYCVFFCTLFASMAAAATVASGELPLILGGL